MNNQKGYVLITGATSGIGLELAKLFAADGHALIIVGREQGSLDSTAEMLRGAGSPEVVKIAKDLFETDAPFQLYDLVKIKGLKVSTLVNNAGQGIYGEFKDTDIRRELAIVQLNICSLIVLTKLFLKDMVSDNNGRILMTSSVASKTPGPWQSVYHGTKAFVQSFTDAIRSELKDTSVQVTALLPGATDTDFFHKAGMENSKAVAEGKLADPADVAKDGYEALQKGDDNIISGAANKIQVAMSNFMPDTMVADNLKKKQAPVDEEK